MPTITPFVETNLTQDGSLKPTVVVKAPENSMPRIVKQEARPPVEAVQTAPVVSEEAPKAVEAPTPKDERIEQLAAREKALQAQARAFKAERDAFMAEKAKASQVSQAPAFDKNAFLSDPTAFGLTPDELSQATLGQLNQSPESQMIKQLQRELAELRNGQKKTLEQVQNTQTQAYQQAVKQISRDVNLLVDNNSAFETIKHEGAQSAVVEFIESTYKEEGIVLGAEEAAKQIEDRLRERALGYSKLSYIAAKNQAQVAASQAPASPAQTRQAPTLTNAMTQASRPTGRLSEKERIERARLAFSGQLK